MNRMTRPVAQEELPELQRKRAEAIKAAGTKWLLHPANHIKRKPVKGNRMMALLAVALLLGTIGNDCDGRCVQTTEVTP